MESERKKNGRTVTIRMMQLSEIEPGLFCSAVDGFAQISAARSESKTAMKLLCDMFSTADSCQRR